MDKKTPAYVAAVKTTRRGRIAGFLPARPSRVGVGANAANRLLRVGVHPDAAAGCSAFKGNQERLDETRRLEEARSEIEASQSAHRRPDARSPPMKSANDSWTRLSGNASRRLP